MREFILHFWSGKGEEWSRESTLFFYLCKCFIINQLSECGLKGAY